LSSLSSFSHSLTNDLFLEGLSRSPSIGLGGRYGAPIFLRLSQFFCGSLNSNTPVGLFRGLVGPPPLLSGTSDHGSSCLKPSPSLRRGDSFTRFLTFHPFSEFFCVLFYRQFLPDLSRTPRVFKGPVLLLRVRLPPTTVFAETPFLLFGTGPMVVFSFHPKTNPFFPDFSFCWGLRFSRTPLGQKNLEQFVPQFVWARLICSPSFFVRHFRILGTKETFLPQSS